MGCSPSLTWMSPALYWPSPLWSPGPSLMSSLAPLSSTVQVISVSGPGAGKMEATRLRTALCPSSTTAGLTEGPVMTSRENRSRLMASE